MRQELPWVVDDWLDYHLDHLGFEHAELYDIDGSLQPFLERRAARGAKNSRGTATISYWKAWPANLSVALTDASRAHPYCTETWAYAHCLTTHRALSRWVMLLHAPDEFVMSPGREHGGELLRVLDGI